MRTENHACRHDAFTERWVTHFSIMRWVDEYNVRHSTKLGYAWVVDNHILRQRVDVSKVQDPEYTFGSPLQLKYLLEIITA